MSAMTDYLERKILDDVLAGTAHGIPATVHFGLYVSATTDAGGGTEVTGGSYARVSVARNATNFPAAATVAGVSTCKNGVAIQFPTATAGWGTITDWAILNGAGTAANMLMHGTLSASRTVVSGDAPRFAIDAFVLTAD